MNNMPLQKIFFSIFSRYLLIGISAMVLLLGGQQLVNGDLLQRGPELAFAQSIGECIDGKTYLGGGVYVPGCEDNTDAGQPGQPGQPAVEACPKIDVVRTEQDCVGDKWCTFNVWQGPAGDGSCTYGRGGAYGCQLIAGKCGYNPAPQPVAPQPVVTTTQLPECPKPGQSGTQQICGGQWAYDVCTITERFSDGTPAKYRCSYSQNANCVGTYSCPAPAPVVTTQACQIKTVKTEQTCIGAQLCTFNFQQQSDCSVVKKGPFNCFESTQCRAVVQPPVVVTPVVPIAQGAGPVSVTNNNNNTNNNSNTNNNNISVNASGARETVREVQTVTAAAPTVVYAQQPAVAGVQVKELPKTGLPVAAWAALAFIPAGFRMRKFRKVQGELENSPVYIWEKREYDANTYSHEQI
ncbi:MAG: hypothetical protein Q8P92_00765 [Candidatus Daviesbacteria bacterium]|nr:hypothetical protein [Candidatus Daviesbacteria bacterium]